MQVNIIKLINSVDNYITSQIARTWLQGDLAHQPIGQSGTDKGL